MRRLKKIISSVLLMALLGMMLATAAFAAETDSAWISVTETSDGTQVSLVADTTVTDGLVKVTYDSTKLTYQNVTVSEAYVAMYAVNAEEAGVVLISWVAPEAYTTEDSIALIQVNFTGTAGEEDITVTGQVHDAEGNAIALGDVDTSALEEAVAAAEALVEEDYTEESFAAVEEALENAKAVLADPTATQEEVDAAAEALNDAIAALEKAPEETAEPVDTTELEAAIKKATELDEDLYTEKSYAAVKEALAEARKVLRNENATQEEVDEATDALNDAISALKRSTGKNPGTGDSAMIGLAVLLVVASAAGVILLVIMKKRGQAK